MVPIVKNKPDNSTIDNLVLVFVCLFFTFLVLLIYDTFLWPPDDGTYAYVADMINKGAVLNEDIRDIHTGYINFTNAVALNIYGNDLKSLRIPLVFITLLQAFILGSLFIKKSRLLAISAVAVLSTLSFLQFINPTANWYALFFICSIIFVLHIFAENYKPRLYIVGVLLGILFGFRQLSGAVALIGIVSFVIYEARPLKKIPLSEQVFAKIVYSIFLILLGYYIWNKSGSIGFALFGFCPLILLIGFLCQKTASNKVTVVVCYKLASGFILALLPLVFYHLANNSLYGWYEDVVLSALNLTELPFIRSGLYELMLTESIANIFTGNARLKVNGLFWLTLLFLPLLLGLAVAYKIFKCDKKTQSAIIVIPVFYALVSVHYQIPIYLFYSSSLTVVAFLYLNIDRSKNYVMVSMFALFLSCVAYVYHAGQPVSRGIQGIIEGQTIDQKTACGVPRCSIKIEKTMAERYLEIVDLVDKTTDTHDTILTIPFNPEINFFSDRRSPLAVFNTGVSLATQESVETAIDVIREKKPKLVILNEGDKYNTILSAKINSYVKENYTYLRSIAEFEVYIKE